jgi:hypothetical protein
LDYPAGAKRSFSPHHGPVGWRLEQICMTIRLQGSMPAARMTSTFASKSGGKPWPGPSMNWGLKNWGRVRFLAPRWDAR